MGKINFTHAALADTAFNEIVTDGAPGGQMKIGALPATCCFAREKTNLLAAAAAFHQFSGHPKFPLKGLAAFGTGKDHFLITPSQRNAALRTADFSARHLFIIHWKFILTISASHIEPCSRL
jgi:hypothetical protein